MGVVLGGLAPLVKQMRKTGVSRVRLPFQHGRVNFDVFLFLDEAPWCLLFGARAYNLAFEVKVRGGYVADTNLANADYKNLCAALGLEYDPVNKFSPTAFLRAFGQALPSVLPTRPLQPHEVAIYRSDVEEKDKIYFCGWRDNTLRAEQVSQSNLHKTSRLLGEAAYLRCKAKNVSSRWTNDADAAIAFADLP